MSSVHDPVAPEEFLQHAGWMTALARGLVSDDQADDVTQETWLAALKWRPKNPRAVRSWLSRVLRNFAYRARQQQQRRLRREMRAARHEASSLTPDRMLECMEAQRRIMDIVMDLEEPYRSTVLLRFFKERSPREISVQQRLPITTVRSRLKVALERLRVRIDREHPGGRDMWRATLSPVVWPYAFGRGGTDISSVSMVNSTATASGAVAKVGFTTGVVTMTSKVLVSVSVFSVVLLVAGVGAWKLTDRGGVSEDSSPQMRLRVNSSRKAEALPTEFEGIRKERDGLALENERLRDELLALRQSYAKAREDEAVAEEASEPAEEDEPGDMSLVSALIYPTDEEIERVSTARKTDPFLRKFETIRGDFCSKRLNVDELIGRLEEEFSVTLDETQRESLKATIDGYRQAAISASAMSRATTQLSYGEKILQGDYLAPGERRESAGKVFASKNRSGMKFVWTREDFPEAYEAHRASQYIPLLLLEETRRFFTSPFEARRE